MVHNWPTIIRFCCGQLFIEFIRILYTRKKFSLKWIRLFTTLTAFVVYGIPVYTLQISSEAQITTWRDTKQRNDKMIELNNKESNLVFSDNDTKEVNNLKTLEQVNGVRRFNWRVILSNTVIGTRVIDSYCNMKDSSMNVRRNGDQLIYFVRSKLTDNFKNKRESQHLT